MTKLQNTTLRLDGCSRCSGCQCIKPSAAFHKDCSRPTGVCSHCKACSASKKATKRVMVRDLRAIVKKHPSLATLFQIAA